jgi:hypothetical protein
MNWIVESFKKSKRLANDKHWEKKRKKRRKSSDVTCQFSHVYKYYILFSIGIKPWLIWLSS